MKNNCSALASSLDYLFCDSHWLCFPCSTFFSLSFVSRQGCCFASLMSWVSVALGATLCLGQGFSFLHAKVKATTLFPDVCIKWNLFFEEDFKGYPFFFHKKKKKICKPVFTTTLNGILGVEYLGVLLRLMVYGEMRMLMPQLCLHHLTSCLEHIKIRSSAN